MNQRTKLIIKEWVESIIIALILALIIRTFIVQAFKIPSGSMKPTLQEGDRILVNKFIYRFKEPQRGDVIVFIYPEDRKKDFIKRLIAKNGETVEISSGSIIINDKPTEESGKIRQIYYYNAGDYGATGKKIEVPKDCYFFLGDNSASSKDSRYWGFVSKKDILGKAMFIYWPLNRIRLIR